MPHIHSSEYKTKSVTTRALADLAVTAAKLANSTISTGKLAAGILSADAAGRALMAASYFDSATWVAKTAVQIITGRDLANTLIGAATAPAANRALAASEIGAPVRLVLDVSDGASGNADFTALPYKILVTNVSYIKDGAAGNAGNSMVLHNGTSGSAITDALNNATANGTKSAATLTNTTVAANATLRVVTVKAGGGNGARILVDAIRIA